MGTKKTGYILKSNYTIAKKHKVLSNGDTIYYRDYMVTNGNSLKSGESPYGESNFKMVVPRVIDEARDHSFGKYILDPSGNTNWTLQSVTNVTEGNKNAIKLNPNLGDLKDLIYYGSCYETVKDSIIDIINNFPAELYVTNKKLNEIYPKIEENDKELGEEEEVDNYQDLVIIDNPFNIDVMSNTIKTDINGNDVNTGAIPNEDRYFCKSLENYTIVYNTSKETELEQDTWHVSGMWEPKSDKEFLFKKCKNRQLIDECIIDNGEDLVSDDDNFYIYRFYVNDKYVLACNKNFIGAHITPNETKKKNFFDNLTDVQKLLLNNKTEDGYEMSIKVPKETENGVELFTEKLTFPIAYGGWNLNVTDTIYEDFLNDLLNICSIYDEYYTNNLWGNMVHDSIKNMDLTFTNEKNAEDSDDFKVGLSKMEKLMYSYGMFFDELKRYIDNIKNVNVTSYTGYNNIPDYLLTDVLTNCGWDTFDPTETFSGNTETGELYLGHTKSYTLDDVYTYFFRLLKINSRAILKKKGTKSAIEMIMGLLGLVSYDFARNQYNTLPYNFKKFEYNISSIPDEKIDEKNIKRIFSSGETYYSYVNISGVTYKCDVTKIYYDFDDLDEDIQKKMYDYKIDEFVCVALPKEENYIYDFNETSDIEQYNSFKNNYDFYTDDKLNGLPLNTIVFEEETNDTGGTETKKYYVPWFDKNSTYDGDLYYQMNGGWEKRDEIILKNANIGIDTVDTIYSNEESGYTLYGETVKYMPVVNNVISLKNIGNNLLDGTIVKLNGIVDENIKVSIYKAFDFEKLDSDITESEEYKKDYSEPLSGSFSNYFYLENGSDGHYKDYFYKDENGDIKNGWINIPVEDIVSGVGYGLLVLYHENMLDNSVGNNPHTGNGYYDDGGEYLQYFVQIFKYSIENDNFNGNVNDCNGNILDKIKEIGFNNLFKDDDKTKINYIKDNQKCWYFSNEKDFTEEDITLLEYIDPNTNDKENKIYTPKFDIMSSDINDFPKEIGIGCNINDSGNTYYHTYENNLKPFDMLDSKNLVSYSSETYTTHEETSADSVINTKKIEISFNTGTDDTKKTYDFITETVLPYIEQLIPSTAIYGVKIINN